MCVYSVLVSGNEVKLLYIVNSAKKDTLMVLDRPQQSVLDRCPACRELKNKWDTSIRS